LASGEFWRAEESMWERRKKVQILRRASMQIASSRVRFIRMQEEPFLATSRSNAL
jgi:hypothetical protein